MLKEKHLKLCYELEPNELKTIKTGVGGSANCHTMAHACSRRPARSPEVIPGRARCLRDEAVEPSNLNTSHSRRLRARREGRAENKPRAIFKNSSGATRVERAAARRATLGFCFSGVARARGGTAVLPLCKPTRARASQRSMSGHNAGG